MNPSAEKRRHPQEDAAVHTEGSKLHRGRGLPIRAFSLFWLTECVHVSTWLFSWMRRVPRCQELFNVSHFISKGRSSDTETMHAEWNVQSVYVYCVCVIYYSHSCVFFLRDQRHLTAQYSCSSIHPTASSHIPLTLLLLSPPLCLFPSFSLTFPPPLLVPVVFASLHLAIFLFFNPWLLPSSCTSFYLTSRLSSAASYLDVRLMLRCSIPGGKLRERSAQEHLYDHVNLHLARMVIVNLHFVTACFNIYSS